MKQKIKVIAVLCVLVSSIVGAYFLYDSLKDNVDGAQLGDVSGNTPSTEDTNENSELHPAYDFTFYDVNGNQVKLSDFYGKPIILNFWASWCGPCQSEMPAFDEIYKEYKDEVHFIMLSVDESFSDATNFISSNSLSLPIYHDKDYAGSIAYGANAIPLTYFINKDGYMVVYANFPLDKDMLIQGIDMIYNP